VTAPLASPGVARYLEAIFYLHAEEQPARPGRLASWLGVAAPSVTEALRRLERDGLVAFDPAHQVIFTTAGREAAAAIVRRHRVLERWLTTELGFDWVAADEEAHALAAAMSDRVLDRLYDRLGHPATCPHGNPIPGVPQPRRALTNLADVPIGGTAVVNRISEVAEHESPDVLRLLQRGGIVPEAPIRVEAQPRGSGVIEVSTGGSSVHLATDIARAVWVSVS
jgi:DtxR family Mn-dependent transcriptional regulator